MWCKDASTSGDHLTQRIESACGEPRDRNRWNAYRRAPSYVFLLRRAIELLHAFVRQNVHPLTATTFGDWLSPRARAHYHKFRISTVGSNYNSFLVRLWWNLDYSTKGVLPPLQRGGSGVLSSPKYIYIYVGLMIGLGVEVFDESSLILAIDAV